jgi:hypothetical protein
VQAELDERIRRAALDRTPQLNPCDPSGVAFLAGSNLETIRALLIDPDTRAAAVHTVALAPDDHAVAYAASYFVGRVLVAFVHAGGVLLVANHGVGIDLARLAARLGLGCNFALFARRGCRRLDARDARDRKR